MKKFILFILPVAFIAMAFTANYNNKSVKVYDEEVKIEWLTFTEAVERNKTNPKMIFIDFYTDWCTWCEKMDNNVFTNPQIAQKLSDGFYAVKFNAEADEVINYNSEEYNLDKSGRRPAHELAQKFGTVNDRLGYPTFALLDETFTPLKSFQGYKTVDRLKQILDYYGDKENYTKKNWIEFIQEQSGN